MVIGSAERGGVSVPTSLSGEGVSSIIPTKIGKKVHRVETASFDQTMYGTM